MMTFGPVTRTVISLLIVGGAAFSVYLMGTPQVPKRPPTRAGAPMVRTAIAEGHSDGIEFEVDGVVVPFRQIDIAAQVSGQIEFKAENCRTGRSVQEGELLIRIDPSDYKLEVARLQEELNQADAMHKELGLEIITAENQIELTRQQLEIDARTLERNLRLSSTNAASQTELDAARRAELGTRNTLQGLQDNRNLLSQQLLRMDIGKALVETNLQKARLALARTEIRSPLDGIIVSESVEQDGYIQAGNTMIRLQDTSQLDVTCKLHMRQMDWLWQSKPTPTGQGDEEVDAEGEVFAIADAYDFPETPAKIVYRIGPVSYQWQGVLDRYDGAGIDNQTRMVPCRVHVDRPMDVIVESSEDGTGMQTTPPTLMTGMFVKAQILAKPPIPLVRIPQEAIQPGNMVWTVADGKLQRKECVATSGPDFILAYQQADGLQAGDVVVVSPLATPVDGLAVSEAGKP